MTTYVPPTDEEVICAAREALLASDPASLVYDDANAVLEAWGHGIKSKYGKLRDVARVAGGDDAVDALHRRFAAVVIAERKAVA